MKPCCLKRSHHWEAAQMTKTHSIFVMLHFKSAKQRSCKNGHVFRICTSLEGPAGQQKFRHRAIFSEPEPGGDFSFTCQQRQTAGKASALLKFSILLCPSCIKDAQELNKQNSFIYFHSSKEWLQDHSIAIKRLIISAPFHLLKGAWIWLSLVICALRSVLICSEAHNSPP